MWLKRLSKVRGDTDDSSSPTIASEKYDARPSSSRKYSQSQFAQIDSQEKMYRRPQEPQQSYSPPRTQVNKPAPLEHSTPAKSEPLPDFLTQAFNSALKPYTDKIDALQAQVSDLQIWVEQLEAQRADVHSWIDKRGLRPDVPLTIAKTMDNQPDAASTLNTQLDRKITIVNFDLHRLQDDLNDTISSSHFASAMLKFLPDIQRLASLSTGPRYAFALILKLGGNLNSHGLESSEGGDVASRRDFYARLDNVMVEVVRRRFQEGEEWQVAREVSRMEKTESYLRGFGVDSYFPMSLEIMRRELDFRGDGTPPRYQ
ncbi:MAG: hypothetical protein M1827_000954 [Pycnora praestabilis]|nr:MAG: hypothetical protein M1827_000954 [Pycnora praestabilis]